MISYRSSPVGLAVVTGATSVLGLDVARYLGARGFELLLVAEDPGVDFVARALRADGIDAEPVQADVATARGVEMVHTAVVARGVRLEVLVLNPGPGVGGPFLRTSLDADIDMIKLNCISVIHLAKRLLPAMVTARSGQVLITSPADPETPELCEAVYMGTKAFLLSFSHAIRHELKYSGVTVTALQPGLANTIASVG